MKSMITTLPITPLAYQPVYRCKRWVVNSRQEDCMTKDEKYLSKNSKLSSDHFEECMLRSNAKKRLKEDGLPTTFAIPKPPKPVGTKGFRQLR